MESMANIKPALDHRDRDIANLKVFYDGSCPICAREMGYYQKIAPSEQIQWVDVSSCTESVLPSGLTREAALARFHVELAEGRVVDGARAFTELWTAIPRLRLLGLTLRRPPLVWGLELGYTVFLNVRPKLQQRISGFPCLKSTQ